MATIEVFTAKLDDERHRQAVIELVNLYANDPMGIGTRLPPDAGPDLVAGLRACPTSMLYLAYCEEQPVGLAVCFWGFSTFAARPLLNLHDLIVDPAYRRQGVASRLLVHLERDALERGCCKVTLEARRDNAAARSLYRKSGFGPGETPYEFWTKTLDRS